MSLTNSPAQPMLTDEEIRAVWVEHGLDDEAVEDFARAIESALLSKLRAPVADEQSVTSILLEVVPGADGMGQEIYATSVDDVKRHMNVLAEELEEWELGIRRLPASAPVTDAGLLSDALYYLKGNLPDGPTDHAHKAAVIARIESKLTIAPVAGEAKKPVGRILYSGKGNQTIFRTYHGANIPEGWHDVYLSPMDAAPEASEAQCSCPSGDGSLRHPCAVHPQSSEAVREAIKTFGSKVFKALAAIARANGPDTRKEDDPELIYRDPVMDEAVRIRQAYDELSAALSAQPGAQKNGGSDAN